MVLVWVLDAGLDPPLCNREVFDLDGRLIGVPDLLDVEADWSASTRARTTRTGPGTARTSSARSASATTAWSSSSSSVATSPGATWQ